MKEYSGGRSQFRLRLEMSGPMLPMILKSVGDRQPEVENFADALKNRVERILRNK